MAGLFGGAEAPQYVAPTGQAIATKTSGGLLGMFPGTPDYVTASPPVTTAPPSGTVPPVVPPQAPAIEVMVRIPGLLNVQGQLCLPPWLLESAPALLPVLIHVLRQRIEGELCRVAPPSTPSPAPCADDVGDESDPETDPRYARSETQDRAWDRE